MSEFTDFLSTSYISNIVVGTEAMVVNERDENVCLVGLTF